MPKKTHTIVAISGGFDPFHIGHLKMVKKAQALGDELVVILNNDHWLQKKKGYVFMPQNERKELLEAISYIDRVVLTKHRKNDPDTSVCRELRKLRPTIFANGGDRAAANIPEYAVCHELGITLRFNVGGGKRQSSSALVKTASRRLR